MLYSNKTNAVIEENVIMKKNKLCCKMIVNQSYWGQYNLLLDFGIPGIFISIKNYDDRNNANWIQWNYT